MIFLVPQTNPNHHHITPTEVIQLKQKLDAELLRRNGYNSVASTSTWDASDGVPTSGRKTYTSQGKAVIEDFLKIEDFGDLRKVNVNDPIPNSFSSDLSVEIDRLAAMPRTGETSDTISQLGRTVAEETQSGCRGACTGLCVGSCLGNCNGCSGCSNACKSGCTGCKGCTASCSNNCTSCSGVCTVGCNGCTGCSATCTNGCNGCSGCSGSRL